MTIAAGAKVKFFSSAEPLRKWLDANYTRAEELWVGFHKKDSGKGGITYAEALDEALCFGWIDGVRHNVDTTSYRIRFSPRKPKSTWSLINTRRARELTKLGRMRPPGMRAFAAREARRTGIYSFENAPRKLEPAYERRFKRSPAAWNFFTSQPPWYQRTASFWVMSAKREQTRVTRLTRLIDDSTHGWPIGPLKRAKK